MRVICKEFEKSADSKQWLGSFVLIYQANSLREPVCPPLVPPFLCIWMLLYFDELGLDENLQQPFVYSELHLLFDGFDGETSPLVTAKREL